MKTTKRFEAAVSKLYTAFHNGTLNSNDCTMCAVGNICNKNPIWSFLVSHHGSGIVNNNKSNAGLIIAEMAIKHTGYSPEEIVTIEKVFLEGTDFSNKAYLPLFIETKEEQFQGLCDVIEYLCKLDNIPNVMDYTKLFEIENDEPKYQLNEF